MDLVPGITVNKVVEVVVEVVIEATILVKEVVAIMAVASVVDTVSYISPLFLCLCSLKLHLLSPVL